MQVDKQQLLDDGYIILREVIPPSQLDELRASFEVLVERQKAIWERERQPSVWETGAQPRLVSFERLIDEGTANTVEIWLHENTLGVSRQLLSVPEAASVAGMMLMCSPQHDHGPANWHRDVHPIDMAPLGNPNGTVDEADFEQWVLQWLN
ncbi:MAG: phytanoyl-CoA dioxygenase family protein [Candidatus Poribacteria bacterium]|nr:phytanoyl-CoA dioxygenase family protein [Candidatus Poribacteria bacterium]